MRVLLSALVFCLCLSINGQQMPYLPKGLHKLTKAELKERPLTLRGIPFYLDGKQVPEKKLGDLVANATYALDYYGDRNGKIKAVVIRASNAAEEKAKKELIPAPRNPIDWRGREAPVFAREDLNGDIIDLEDLKGKIVVLSFWYIKCKSCIGEMPVLGRLARDYRVDEVVFLAPTMNIRKDVREFLNQQKFDVSILPNSRSLAKRYGVMVYPMYFVIDQKGVVQFCQYEASNDTFETLGKQIDLLLDK